jgi:hypothetical protein
MSNEDLEFDPIEVGVQNDGEPVAVEETPAPQEETQEAAPEVTPDEQPEDEPKKKTGSQRARERAARLEAENEALRRLLLQNQPKQEIEAPKPDTAGKPRAEDFNSHEDWVEAVADWKTDQKLAQIEARREQERRSHAWNEKADAARSLHEDFDEALAEAPAPVRHVAEVLSDSPLGAELAYYLATHPTEYRRINALPPTMAARELGRLEAGLEPSKKQEAPKPQTKAPRPPAPVNAPPAPKPSEDGRLVVY